ncbi:MAG: hypothetical protein KBF58_03670 [Methyloversatilis sp.]|jgi:hypothetical protein|nr:hypothetical protein [Methyloversatilis sp.]MBP6195547.1 hypothetical protein [Methyloversatilis sp.]MBP9117158.1 hypothetical protein [Methyloversatilis sp.]
MHAHVTTPELHVRIGGDGRIECRSSQTADAPALSIAPDFFGAPDSADAQRALGRFVFSLLQGLQTSGQTAPAPDAAASRDDGPQALYDKFVEMQTQAMKEYSSSLLAAAEQSLQQSAAAGYAPALDALKDWPSIRTVADMLIARGPEQPR